MGYSRSHTRDPPRAAGKEIVYDIDVIVTAKYNYLVSVPDEIVEAAESDNPAVREAGREQLAAWADPDHDPVIMSDVVVLDYDADLLLPGQAHDPVNQSLQDAIDDAVGRSALADQRNLIVEAIRLGQYLQARGVVGDAVRAFIGDDDENDIDRARRGLGLPPGAPVPNTLGSAMAFLSEL